MFQSVLELKSKHPALEAQIASLRAEFEPQEAELAKIIGQQQAQGAQLAQGRVDMGVSRKRDAAAMKAKRGSK